MNFEKLQVPISIIVLIDGLTYIQIAGSYFLNFTAALKPQSDGLGGIWTSKGKIQQPKKSSISRA